MKKWDGKQRGGSMEGRSGGIDGDSRNGEKKEGREEGVKGGKSKG